MPCQLFTPLKVMFPKIPVHAVAVRAARSDVDPVGDDVPLDGLVDGAAVKRENALAGPVSQTDRVLWVLQRAPVAIQGDSQAPVILFNWYLGNWTIEGDMARNVEPGRTLPVAQLKGLLTKERAATYRHDDTRGKSDPSEVE